MLADHRATVWMKGSFSVSLPLWQWPLAEHSRCSGICAHWYCTVTVTGASADAMLGHSSPTSLQSPPLQGYLMNMVPSSPVVLQWNYLVNSGDQGVWLFHRFFHSFIMLSIMWLFTVKNNSCFQKHWRLSQLHGSSDVFWAHKKTWYTVHKSGPQSLAVLLRRPWTTMYLH